VRLSPKKYSKKNPQTILVVDDDLHILEVIEARLVASDFSVIKACSAETAIKELKQHKINLMICDVKLPDLNGFQLFKKVRAMHDGLPVIFLTAFGTIPDAVRAMKAGAVEYLTKPFDGRELVHKINEVLKQAKTVHKKAAPLSQKPYFGKSSAMKELHDMVQRVAAIDVNVLILGESGVGKEVIANMLHDLSSRREKPFIIVDCGSTPAGLLESELFGHVKGSFTHAIRDKKGLIEMANQGTLFLDEIGNVSPEMQMRLLRFLEDHKIRRIGDTQEISVNCRVIAATNTNLLEDIRSGEFREDLYYRLRVVTLNIPPLRERSEDIPGFVKYFVETFCSNKDIPLVEILPETIRTICEYPWPGNVRELRNALEAAVALCPDGVLRPKDIRLPSVLEMDTEEELSESPFSLEESERQTIIRALKETGGVQKSAADLLGISRRAIHYKIKKYGIKPHDIQKT
jgi:DNA-binding NtrC family response regulator